jgi:hypothetical protein
VSIGPSGVAACRDEGGSERNTKLLRRDERAAREDDLGQRGSECVGVRCGALKAGLKVGRRVLDLRLTSEDCWVK